MIFEVFIIQIVFTFNCHYWIRQF